MLLQKGAGQSGDALAWSAIGGHTAIAAQLLNRGADVHYLEDRPLRYACWYGQLDAVRLLLNRGAHVNARNGESLRWARRRGRDAVIRLLFERGAA